MSEYVYFIGNEKEVKIGKTNNLNSRFSTIQTSSSGKLELLASVRCLSMSVTEKMLHKAFADIRFRGEWFYRVGDLARLIIRLQVEKNPTEFTLGLCMGEIIERNNHKNEIVLEHRLRATNKAILKSGVDMNGEAFHSEYNRFLDLLVDEHPTMYKTLFAASSGALMQILDVPHQPFPTYEVSIQEMPDEAIVDRTRPSAA